MYNILLTVHSLFRWAVLISLIYSIAMAAHGVLAKVHFSKVDNHIRHWTATICHIQLMAGIILYTQSPMISYYFSAQEKPSGDAFFFSVLHLVLMLIAIIIITIGSAKAKREIQSRKKFSTILLWFSAGLLIILIVIPWPFSPLASRPYIRL